MVTFGNSLRSAVTGFMELSRLRPAVCHAFALPRSQVHYQKEVRMRLQHCSLSEEEINEHDAASYRVKDIHCCIS